MVALVALTLASLTVAAVTSIVAWRVVREERRRSDARVDRLAAEIRGGDVSGTTRAVLPDAAAPGAAFRPPPGAIVAIGVLVVGGGLVLAAMLTSGSHGPRPSPAATGGAVVVPPLELVALGHERDGDRLIVRGVVRNPAGRAAIDGLTAVVLVFDHAGAFAAGGRATVDAHALAGGTASPFVVTVTGVSEIDRYRVSFRTDERMMEHVDKRE